MPAKTKRASSRAHVRVILKKTLLLDQTLLDRAKDLLGARTETDTVTQALETVVRREQQIAGVRALSELGPIDGRRIG
jgi:hypothetical protein